MGLSNQPTTWGVAVDPKATFLTLNWTLGHGHTHLSSQAIDSWTVINLPRNRMGQIGSATLKTADVCFHPRICLGFCLLSAPSSPDKQCQNPYIALGACNSFSKTSFHWGSHGSSTLSLSCGVEMDGSLGLTSLSSHTVGTSAHQPQMSWALCQLSDWYQVGA